MSQIILVKGAGGRNAFVKKLLNAEFGPYFVVFSLIAFVVLITVLTLMFSAQQVTKGYVLDSLESKNSELSRVNEVKDMQISVAKSLNSIQSSEKVGRMIKLNPKSLVYVSGETAIAKR